MNADSKILRIAISKSFMSIYTGRSRTACNDENTLINPARIPRVVSFAAHQLDAAKIAHKINIPTNSPRSSHWWDA